MSSLKAPISDENCWELTKENIQPLKAGRCISNVSTSNEMSLKQQRQGFEEELRVNNGDDPLDVWYRYIKWTEHNFPSGKDNQLRSLVQKCLSVLKEHKQYANDFRWWFVWQKFASLSSNVGSLGIYEFMHSSEHCTRLASFYKQWAYELEKAEDYPKATEVYKRGIAAKAQPLNDLENAFDEFEMRIGRKLMSQPDDDADVDESTRNFLGVLKGIGKKAVAPSIRQSSTQEVKIAKPIEKTPATSRGFAVFDEKQVQQSQNLNCGKEVMHVASIGNESTKENLRDPGVWTKQKVKIGNVSSAKDNVPEFRVFVDENVSNDDRKPKPLITGGILKPVAKQELVSSFFPSENVEKPKHTNKTELKEVPAYNEKLIYGGLIEMSFEELRALNFQPKKTNCSNSFAKTCQTAMMNLPMQKNTNQFPNAQLVVNSSFTSNVVRDAMAVFSNTLQVSCDGSNPSGLENSSCLSKFEQAFDPPLLRNSQPIVGAGGFKIFDENADCDVRSRSSTLPSNNENKENLLPSEIVSQIGFKRQTSGILTPALDIISEPEEKPPVEDLLPTKLFSAACSKAIVAPNSTITNFDDYDPTVAGMMKSLLSERAASTPCHTQIMVPSFSMTKPWQIPFEIENQMSFETEDVPVRETATMKVEQVIDNVEQYSEKSDACFLAPPAYNNFVDRKLSTITETSREYRSSSCSSSSSASSGDAFSTRKRLLCASTNSTNLQTISEQLTFAHCTPSSQAALFGITPQDHAISAICRQPSTPYDVFSIDAPVFEPKAVRRLYSDNENVDENLDRTGFGTKVFITSRINPWDPEVVAQLLMRIPKRLDMFTNFHHFATNLPAIKVGKNVDLGGESYLVKRFLGEGAFAKVYNCVAEDCPDSSLVLKVQKPCCPWEFYVCEELRRRLTQQNLLTVVSRAIMRVKDAFIFADGSVLTSDYCPFSTLLEVVNKFKASSMSMNESFVVYLTIEIMKILETVHACGFIHADIKPDNFLFCGPEIWPNDNHQVVFEDQVQCLCLIDWGRAIDMNLMPHGTVFTGKVNTSGFQCCEMQEGRSWTYQTDFYGLLGTVHVMLFGDYMRVYKCSSSGRWKISSAFKRKWNVDMWRKLFDTLLNVPDCNSLPNLTDLRMELESFYHSKCDNGGVNLNDQLMYLKTII